MSTKNDATVTKMIKICKWLDMHEFDSNTSDDTYRDKWSKMRALRSNLTLAESADLYVNRKVSPRYL